MLIFQLADYLDPYSTYDSVHTREDMERQLESGTRYLESRTLKLCVSNE
jgi:hypothetical protein